MAIPVQYTSQFIPTDIGAMSNLLGQRQTRYDQALAGQLAMEDAYAQLPSTPQDIAGKQVLLNQFKTDVQSIVDRYGGDYGAASKDIARLVSKKRQDPSFQLLPQAAKLAEEQRRLQAQYGPSAMTLREVPQVLDPETGKVMVSPEDLRYSVLDQRQLEKALETEFGNRARMIRESGLSPSTTSPGMLVQTKTRGITDEEVPGVTEEMMTRLSNMNPDLAAAIEEGDPRALQIAQNMAQQLVGGIERQYTRDPLFGADGSRQLLEQLNYLRPTDVMATKGRKELTDLKKGKKLINVDETSSPIQRAYKQNLDYKIFTPDFITSNGLEDYVITDQEGAVVPDATYNQMKEDYDQLNNRYTKVGDTYSIRRGQPGATTREAIEQSQLDIDRLKNLKRAIGNYETRADFIMENQIGDLQLQFSDINSSTGDLDLDKKRIQRKGIIDKTFDGLDGYQMNFLSTPREMRTLTKEKEKKRSKFIKDEELAANGALTPLGISTTPFTGVVFRVEDKEGREYMVRPKDPNTVRTLLDQYDPNGMQGYQKSEAIYRFNEPLMQTNWKEVANKYPTYNDYVSSTVPQEYWGYIMEYLVQNNINPNDNLKPIL